MRIPLTSFALALAAALPAQAVPPPEAPADAPTLVRTEYTLLVGYPEASASAGTVVIVPGTVLSDSSVARYTKDITRLCEQLADSYRLARVEQAAATVIRLERGRTEALPTAKTGLHIDVTLADGDLGAGTALYAVQLRQSDGTVKDVTVGTRFGERAVIGTKDGPAAPYAFIFLAPRPEVPETGVLIPEPRLIHSVQPEYPPEARKQRVQGRVELQVAIGPDGRVEQVEYEGNAPKELVQAAVDAVKQWRYEPPRDASGKVTRTTITVTVSFSLH